MRFKLVKQSGKPGEVICKLAAEEKVSLIVVGSRGKGVVRRTVIGSVSDYIVHHCGTPVCVVPPEESVSSHRHQHHKGYTQFDNIGD